MDTILGYATKLSAGKHHSVKNDDVFIDRLNHRYTVSMILVFAAIVTTQQYFGSPISCWVPAQFTSGYEKYANDICWIMNTYYVPMDVEIPRNGTRYEQMLKYYQWSPFILMFMGLCFYFPRMLWRALNNRSGLDMDKLVEIAMKVDDKEFKKEREQRIEQIAHIIQTYIENRYSSGSGGSNKKPLQILNYVLFWRRRHLSSYLFILFTVVKFLFFFNSILQIILLNAFLGNEYHLFGFDVIRKVIGGVDWGESKRFPRVTLCDFHIREIGIVHRYTVQCVLPINLFNEKIFLILWFWILILTTFNAFDFFAWLLRILKTDSRTSYVVRKLRMVHGKTETLTKDSDDARDFVQRYLQADGCFALRLLARNGHDLIVGEVIEHLFRDYRRKNPRISENTDHSISFPNSKIPPLPPNRRGAASNNDGRLHDEERFPMNTQSIE